jgi:hypothetical protein
MKCDTCGENYSSKCDFNQGRCPHHPPLFEPFSAKNLLFLLAAPAIIGAWAIMNPCKVIEQAKKDWNIK